MIPWQKIKRENILAYFYLLRDEFIEIREVIRELIKYEPFKLDVRHATPIHKALNITVFISYSRNFKNSYGFEFQDSINEEIINDFTEAEKKLHDKIEDERDEEFAHSDFEAHDIKFNEFIDVNYSSRVVRPILDKKNLIYFSKW